MTVYHCLGIFFMGIWYSSEIISQYNEPPGQNHIVPGGSWRRIASHQLWSVQLPSNKEIHGQRITVSHESRDWTWLRLVQHVELVTVLMLSVWEKSYKYNTKGVFPKSPNLNLNFFITLLSFWNYIVCTHGDIGSHDTSVGEKQQSWSPPFFF